MAIITPHHSNWNEKANRPFHLLFLAKKGQHAISEVNTLHHKSVTDIANPSRAPEFSPGFQWGSCYSIFSFMFGLQIDVCSFVFFLLVIVLFVLLRYMDFDYPFGIFKLFFHLTRKINMFLSFPFPTFYLLHPKYLDV